MKCVQFGVNTCKCRSILQVSSHIHKDLADVYCDMRRCGADVPLANEEDSSSFQ